MRYNPGRELGDQWWCGPRAGIVDSPQVSLSIKISGFGFALGAVGGVEIMVSPIIGIAVEGGIDVIFGTTVIVQPKGHAGVNLRF